MYIAFWLSFWIYRGYESMIVGMIRRGTPSLIHRSSCSRFCFSGQQTAKTVAIVLGGAVGVGFLVICLLFAKSLAKKKDGELLDPTYTSAQEAPSLSCATSTTQNSCFAIHRLFVVTEPVCISSCVCRLLSTGHLDKGIGAWCAF